MKVKMPSTKPSCSGAERAKLLRAHFCANSLPTLAQVQLGFIVPMKVFERLRSAVKARESEAVEAIEQRPARNS